jgi:alkylated DNA repair dioxygenase AlkB
MSKLINTNTSSLIVDSMVNNKALVDNCIDYVTERLHNYPKIIIYGKVCYQRRAIGFFSDVSAGYKYSGQIAKSHRLNSHLKNLLKFINNKYDTDFNGILVNKYNDGTDYISDHTDNEKEISKKGVISISYGATRKFRIRNKKTKKIIMDIPTQPYQIIQMLGNFQKEFLHGIPVEKKVKHFRISFTFRKHE